MSHSRATHDTTEVIGKKRKADQDEAELEIDLEAPEPASKKAARKAKKLKTSQNGALETPAEGQEAVAFDSRTLKTQGSQRQQPGIWVGNLSYTTTKSDLQTFLTTDESHVIKPEQITRINLPTGPPKFGKQQNKGFAYVDFTDANALENALELSEKLFSGRRVLIKNAKSFEGRPASTNVTKKEDSDRTPNSRIFVGNLGFDTTKENLEEHFQACGRISNIHMATFEDSGKCKGYAWIEFEQISSAQSAIRGWVEVGDTDSRNNPNKNATKRTWVGKIEGRKLRMEYAEDRTTRYNKRFGKGSHAKDDNVEGTSDTELTLGETSAPDTETKPVKNVAFRDRRTRSTDISSMGVAERGTKYAGRRKKEEDSSKYARETVERLRGAIVPSEGTKVTFD